MRRALFAVTLAAPLLAAAPAAAQEHEGYYYPPITSEETFTRRMAPAPIARASSRVGLVNALAKAQMSSAAPARWILFEKGERSRKLIMVALDDEIFRTPFRARAVLASISTNLRLTEFFKDEQMRTAGTFFDVLQLLGFDSLTISDGATWSHRINFE